MGLRGACSATWAMRHTTADPVAEQIHAALGAAPDGAHPHPTTRPLLRPQPPRRPRADTALTNLANNGRAQRRRIATAGRPAEIWVATNR